MSRFCHVTAPSIHSGPMCGASAAAGCHRWTRDLVHTGPLPVQAPQPSRPWPSGSIGGAGPAAAPPLVARQQPAAARPAGPAAASRPPETANTGSTRPTNQRHNVGRQSTLLYRSPINTTTRHKSMSEPETNQGRHPAQDNARDRDKSRSTPDTN